jgi:hypothetical protein
MRLKAFALCIVAGFSTSASAQNETQTLEQALKQIPESAISTPAAMQVFFLDVQAWRGLEPAGPTADGMRRLVLAQSIRPLQSTGYGLDKWSASAKISFDELSYFAAFGQAPADFIYWGLKTKQSAVELVDALKKGEFTAVDGDVSGLIANGEAGKIDITKANSGDPWRGEMGTASFVLPLDNALVQASSPAGIEALAKPTPSLADTNIVAVSVAGLKEAVSADSGTIVQAAVISPVFGLQGVDPAKILPSSPDDIETAKQNLKAAIETSERGIPPYFSGIIADVQTKDAPAVVISLSYENCSAANKAVEGIQAAWKQSMPDMADVKVSGRTVEAEKLCAAVVSFETPKTDGVGNPVLTAIVSRYLQRDSTVLQIGSSF